MANEPINDLLSPEGLQLLQQLQSIFMPHYRRRQQAAIDNKLRLVHYTSAEAAVSIIRTKCLWMRNTTCMSDYREVQYGFEIINSLFLSNKNTRDQFVAALDSGAPGAALGGFKLFDEWWNDIQLSSYVFSLSEHDRKEDRHGRLSMWRAFGEGARVAIVCNIPWESAAGVPLNLMFSPVAYFTAEEIRAEIEQVIENIKASSGFLCSVNRAHVVACVFAMLMAGVLCLKHEGFHEEREWRAIYAPKRLPSVLMEHSTEVIRGVPQLVYKAPLDKKIAPSLADLDLSSLLDHVIIGPSEYPWAMYEAFVEELKVAGVPDAKDRVLVSGIPIRT